VTLSPRRPGRSFADTSFRGVALGMAIAVGLTPAIVLLPGSAEIEFGALLLLGLAIHGVEWRRPTRSSHGGARST